MVDGFERLANTIVSAGSCALRSPVCQASELKGQLRRTEQPSKFEDFEAA
jgi:hypothetical protein